MLRQPGEMSTGNDRGLGSVSSASLQGGQFLTLTRPEKGVAMTINVQNGFIRISSACTEDNDEITMALMSSVEQGTIWYPNSITLQAEAIKPTKLEISYHIEKFYAGNDYLCDWIMLLHWVRHPIKTDDRLMRLIAVMSQRLGRRTIDGYRIEFLLPHARLGEIIGATRSTVSRTIGALRKQKRIIVDDEKKELIVPINN